MAVETKTLNCIMQLEKSLGKKLTPEQINIISEYGIEIIKESHESMRQSLKEAFEEKQS